MMYVRNHNKRLRTDDAVDLLVKLFRTVQATEVLSQAPAEGGFIATHNGKFHCDEVLACAMLKTLPQFQAMPIVRLQYSYTSLHQHIFSKSSMVIATVPVAGRHQYIR